jgi:hypothetical protein
MSDALQSDCDDVGEMCAQNAALSNFMGPNPN